MSTLNGLYGTVSESSGIIGKVFSVPVVKALSLPFGNRIERPKTQSKAQMDNDKITKNMRQFNHPAFHCRAEFVEAMRQLLEVSTHRLPFSYIFTALTAGPCILPRLQYLPLVRGHKA
jgi:hypothetical protein